jgi:hypothetical protein
MAKVDVSGGYDATPLRQVGARYQGLSWATRDGRAISVRLSHILCPMNAAVSATDPRL